MTEKADCLGGCGRRVGVGQKCAACAMRVVAEWKAENAQPYPAPWQVFDPVER